MMPYSSLVIIWSLFDYLDFDVPQVNFINTDKVMAEFQK